MQKKLVQSSLALTAAAALGLGGAFVAGPAAAAGKPDVNVQTDSAVQTAVHKNLADKNGELASEVGRFGVKGDTLVLGVSAETDKVEKLASKYDNVEVIVDAKYTAADPQGAKDLVGGAGYLTSIPSDAKKIGACSTGFAGWDSSGNQVVLTAGHCAVDTTTGAQDDIVDLEKPSIAEAAGGEGFQPAGTGAPGTWKFHQYGSEINEDDTVADENKAIDFAVMNVADGFTSKAEVTDWTTAKDDDLSKSTTKISKVGAETPGAAINKSGRTTGVTEGTVLDDPKAFEYANVGGRAIHGFEVTSGAERFSDHGDSGGAVYQGDTAVGVISGGPADGAWTWVADLDNSLDKSGEAFTFDDPNETPEVPAAPKVEDQVIEPKGDVTGKAEAGAKVEVTWEAAKGAQAAKGTQAAKEDSETVKVEKDGTFVVEGPKAEGVYAYSATATVDGEESKTTEFEVTVEKEETEAPAPVEREINVDPKEIVASDFVKDDKGVTVTVKGFDEGEKVTLEVASGPENVEGITLDETANENGAAAFSIYGTSETDPSVYLGKYDVTVTGANDTDDEKALAGSFSVVADEDGNGGGNDDGDNGDGGDGGSELPRTGAELTGLAAGAGLLVVGGAAVVLTMRRNKKN